MKRIIAAVGLILFSLYLVSIGVKRAEHVETAFNANLLCLSCIGIE